MVQIWHSKKLICGILLHMVINFCSELHAQQEIKGFKNKKQWSYISGAQRAVNDSNRVYYLSDIPYSGVRVSNFDQMELLDQNDSQFFNLHLDANQVYGTSLTKSSHSFFISKYEVTNKAYRDFVEDCIQKIMEKNRPEIVKEFKFTSKEYIQAFANWLVLDDSINAMKLSKSESKINSWLDFWLLQLNNQKITYKGVSVFPKIDAWITNSMFTFGEPMRDYYFVHPAYNNYPVTCVTNLQAMKYCEWYTENQEAKTKSKDVLNNWVYRLPTEEEWERAASVVSIKPNKKSSGSPVHNNFLRNAAGVYIANYRFEMIPVSMYSSPVSSYFPNDAGCYNMQGNVAEWTMTNATVKSIKPIAVEVPDHALIKKYWSKLMQRGAFEGQIIKGGSWALPEAACTIGSRSIIPNNEASNFVGFRMVATQIKPIRPTITPEF